MIYVSYFCQISQIVNSGTTIHRPAAVPEAATSCLHRPTQPAQLAAAVTAATAGGAASEDHPSPRWRQA